MSQRVLISVLVLFCLKIASVSAQSLDPLQTVNTATGEMGFALPLAVIQGNNGHNAPISLNYQAGIQLRQPASSIGLGFSSAPGVITREVVITADDNQTNYETTMDYKDTKPWWAFVISGILVIVGIIVSIWSQQHEVWGPIVMAITALVGTVVSHVTSEIAFGSKDYIAGGTHVPTLTTKNDERPTGVMYSLTGDDLPDIFRISTPYLSGELYFDRYEKKFKMRQSGGSSIKNKETVNIDFDLATKVFKITLADGTTLIFSQLVTGKPEQYTFYQGYPNNSSTELYETFHYKTFEPIVYAWYLTSVLFNDYVDANGNNTPDQDDNGSWIKYQYDETINDNCRQLPFNQQASTNAATISFSGDRLHDVYLRRVVTPIESAEYIYKDVANDPRLDDLWFPIDNINWGNITDDSEEGFGSRKSNQRNANPYSSNLTSKTSSSAEPVKRKVLNGIIIYNRNGVAINKIRFNTDYSLRPHTFSSYSKNASAGFEVPDLVKNPQAGTLTLKSIDFMNDATKPLSSIQFTYSKLNPDGCDVTKINEPPFPEHDIIRAKFFVEAKDLWGYYYPAGSSNKFPWEVSKELTTPYAEAWSLKSVKFSTGMAITWDYESHKYDLSNDQHCALATGEPRIGGGIRVKRVTVDDGMGKKTNWRYFYTTGPHLQDWTDLTNDTCNSSGYVPVHPYDYIASGDYRETLHLPKGGLYTPTKVSYEMVRIAQNYNEDTKVAPQGFTSVGYTSTKDYPNSGNHSDIDRSIVRGLPTVTAVYNKDGKLLTRTTKEYNVIANPAPRVEQLPDYWINLKKVKEYANGIETEKQMLYAQEGTIDAVVSEKQIPLNNYYKEMELVSLVGNPHGGDIFNRCGVDFEYGTFYGNPAKKDLIGGMGIMRNDEDGGLYVFRRYFLLALGEDIEFSATQTPYNWKYGVLNYPFDVDVGNSDTTFIDAFALTDLNSNVKQDAVILEVEDSYKKISYRVGFDIEPTLFTESGSSVELASLNDAHSTGITFDRENDRIACAGIKNIVSSTSKDLVLILYTHRVQYQIVIIAGLNADGTYTKIYKSDPIPDSNAPYDGFCWDNWCYDGSISAEMVNLGGSYPDIILTKFSEPRVKKLFEEVHVTDSPDKVLFEQNVERFKYPVGGIQNIGFTGVRDKEFSGAVYPEDGEYCYQKPVYTGIELFSDGPFFCIHRIIGTTPVYFDYDGQPNRIIEKKGSFEIVSDAIPAYWEYPQMDATETHLLTPTCKSTSYQNMEDGPNWVSASVSTWGQDGKFWFPKASYVWKVKMTAQGTTNEIPPVFYYTNHSLNQWNVWKLTDSVGSYNNHRNFVETFKPGPKSGQRIGSVSIVNKKGLALGSVGNAVAEECAVFTCDYDFNVDGYFDKENLWSHQDGTPPPGSICLVDNTMPHFGQKSLYVKNAKAAARNVAVNSPTAKITWSAWVRPVNTNPIRFAASIVANGVGNTNICYDYLYNTTNGLVADKWQLVKFTIDISKPSANQKLPAEFDGVGDDGIYIWVGNHPGEPQAEFYIDDIRIYPKNALVTTTYYDQKWYQPILSVDANNNLSQKVEYDEFGRPVRWYKVDKTDPSNVTLLQKKEYYLHGEFLAQNHICLYYPNGTENFSAGNRIAVSWAMLEQGNVTFSYKKEGDPTYTNIGTQPYTAGDQNYSWAIPGELVGEYKFKVTNTRSDGTTCSDESDLPFRITATSIQAPVSTSEWIAGSEHQIKWTFAGPNTVDIYYDNGTTRVLIASDISNTGGNGTFEWKIPLNYKTAHNSKIVIINHDDSSKFLESQIFLIMESNFITKWLIGLFGN